MKKVRILLSAALIAYSADCFPAEDPTTTLAANVLSATVQMMLLAILIFGSLRGKGMYAACAIYLLAISTWWYFALGFRDIGAPMQLFMDAIVTFSTFVASKTIGKKINNSKSRL